MLQNKNAAIVNCIDDYFFENLNDNMQNLPFSLMIDGSNDTGIQKEFPVTICIYDTQFSRIMTKFFEMSLLEGVTASTIKSIFNSVDTLFSRHGIPWDYRMAIGLDNTNANIGEHNSIKSRTREKNDNIIIAGCSCNILNNTSSKAGDAFNKITGFDISNHCVNVYYWFEKSSNGSALERSSTSFLGLEYNEIINFHPLALFRVVH